MSQKRPFLKRKQRMNIKAKKSTYIGLFILIVSSFAVMACAERNAEQTKMVNSELEIKRRLWRESKIVDYDFVSTWYQGGPYTWVPVTIKVRNSQAISMEAPKDKGELQRIDGYENFDTVE